MPTLQMTKGNLNNAPKATEILTVVTSPSQIMLRSYGKLCVAAAKLLVSTEVWRFLKHSRALGLRVQLEETS